MSHLNQSLRTYPFSTGLAFVLICFWILQILTPDHMGWLAYNPAEGWFTLGLFTYALIHGGWLHLIANLIAITVIPPVEKLHGSLKVAGVFLSGSLVGGLFHHLLHTDVIVGASGGLMAVIMLFLFSYPQSRILFLFFPVQSLAAAFILITISIIGLYLPDQYIGHACHLGGICVGLISYLLLDHLEVPLKGVFTIKLIQGETVNGKIVAAWFLTGIIATALQIAHEGLVWSIFNILFLACTLYLGVDSYLKLPARAIFIWSLGIIMFIPKELFLHWDTRFMNVIFVWAIMLWIRHNKKDLQFLAQSIRVLGLWKGWRYDRIRRSCVKDPELLVAWAKSCREFASEQADPKIFLEFADKLEKSYKNVCSQSENSNTD